MQKLEFANKKITPTSKSQKTEQKQVEESKIENLREVKGAALATSRRIYRIQNSDTFYVESENGNNIFYFVRYNPSVFEWCSCPDNSIRGKKCKHQFAIEHAIRKGTLRDIEHLPAEAQRYPQVVTAKDYREQREEDDEYSF